MRPPVWGLAVWDGTEMSICIPQIGQRISRRHKLPRASRMTHPPILEPQIEPEWRLWTDFGPKVDDYRMKIPFQWKSHYRSPFRGIANSVVAAKV